MAITDEQYKEAARKAYAAGDVATARSLLNRLSTYKPEAAPAPAAAQPSALPTEVAPAPKAQAPQGYLQERGPGPTGRIDPELYEMGAIGRRPDAQPGFAGRGGEGAAPAPTPFDNEGGAKLLKRRAVQFGTGAIDAAARIPEGGAIIGAAADNARVEGAADFAGQRAKTISDIEAKLKDPKLPSQTRKILERNLADLKIGQGKLDEIASEPVVPAKDRPGYETGAAIRAGGEEIIGKPDERDKSFWGRFATTAGGAATMIGATVVGGAATGVIGATVAGATTGAAMSSSGMYDEAIAAGADEETAMSAAKWGLAIGASEVLPVLTALKLLPSAVRNKMTNAFLKRVGDIALNAGEEAAQEAIATIAGNLVAQKYYDPERGVWEDVGEAALMGAMLGGGLSAAASVVQTGDIAPDAAAALKPKPTAIPPDASTTPPGQPKQEPNKDIAPDIAAAMREKNVGIARTAIEELRANQAKAIPPAPPVAPVTEAIPTGMVPPPEPVVAPEPVAAPVPAQEAPPVAPVAEVAPEAQEAPAPVPTPSEVSGDTLPTVPEAPATIELQIEHLQDRKNPRKAVYIPYETEGSAVPFGPGITSMPLEGGMLYVHTGKGLGMKGIQLLVKNGQLGKVLGLGDISKAAAAKSAAAGNPEVAVTERTPEGLEVKAAAGTTETAPEQVAALEAEKTPGNTVQVESPAKVLSDRLAANQKPADASEIFEQAPTAESVAPATPAGKPAAAAKVKATAESRAAKASEKLAAIAAAKEQAVADKKAEDEAKEAARIERLKAFSPDAIAAIEAGANKPKKQVTVLESTPEQQAEIDAAEQKIADRQQAEADKAAQLVKDDEADTKAGGRKEAAKEANKGKYATAAEESDARADPKSHNKSRDKARKVNAIAAEKLSKDLAPYEPETLRSVRDIPAIRDRISATVAEADKRKVTTPGSIEGTHTNSQVWLATVRLMNKKLADFDTMSEGARNAVMGELATFLVDETMYIKAGDADSMREQRLADGARNSKPASTEDAAGRAVAEETEQTTAREGSDGDGDTDAGSVANEDKLSDLDKVEAEQTDGETREFENLMDLNKVAPPSVRPAEDANPELVGDPKAYRATTAKAPVVESKPKPKVLNKPTKGRFRKQAEPVEMASGQPPQGDFLTLSEPSVTATKDDVQRAETRVEKLDTGDNDPWKEHFDLLDEEGKRPEDYAVHVADLQSWQENVYSDPDVQSQLGDGTKAGSVSQWVMAAIMRRISEVAGDVKVMILPDNAFDMFMGDRTTAGVYIWARDVILVPERSYANMAANPRKFMELLQHEAAHAAFVHAMQEDAGLKAAVETAMAATKAAADRAKDKRFADAFLDVDEFIAEAMSNAEFQQFLEATPLPTKVAKTLGDTLKERNAAPISSAFDWIKRKLAEIVGVKAAAVRYGFDPIPSLFDAVMEITDYLVAVAPSTRGMLYSGRSLKRDDPNIKELTDRGLPDDIARDISAFIRDELDGNVSAGELDAIVDALKADMLDAAADTAKLVPAPTNPKYAAPVPPTAPPMPPRVAAAVAKSDNPKNFGKLSFWRRARMKLQTLDYVARRYKPLFEDALGNALQDYAKAALSYGPAREKAQLVHDGDFAAFEDLRRKFPAEAAKMAELAAALAPLDLDLRPGATNLHLSKAGMRDVQDKHMLPILQQKFTDMEPATRELFLRMTDNFRDTHNSYMRGVTRNTLARLTNNLPESEIDRLTDAVVDGKLTDADGVIIDDPELFKTLLTSKELQRRKGMYFPSMRFGDFVVTTKMTIKDPGITSVVTRAGKQQVPVRTEIVDGRVFFSFDYGIRGARPAVRAAVKKWAEAHDLPLQTFVTKYRDRKTGKIVNKGDEHTDREYDMVYEFVLQTNGVHYFEDKKEAYAFHQQALKDFKAGILSEMPFGPVLRRNSGISRTPNSRTGKDLMRKIEASDMKEHVKTQARVLLNEVIAQQMPGNRYQHRLVKRQNVLGQSAELGRAAAHYGRAAGNMIAMVETGPARMAAFDRIEKIAKQPAAGAESVISEVVEELRTREEVVGGPENNNRLVNDLLTMSQINLLFSAANWTLNATQPIMASLPLLGGRYGMARTAIALSGAYYKIGVVGTVARGVRNTGIAVTRAGKYTLDTSNLVESIRKNLGTKYAELIDSLVEINAISNDAGIENAANLSAGRGRWGTGLAKMDRVTRQMPVTIEAVSRSVTAVAAYDLARGKGKMSHADAIAFAVGAVQQSQGQYDSANQPAWMQNAGLAKFFLVFKKFAQMQYQLYGDMLYRTFKGDTRAEKYVAFKQVMALTGMNFLAAGMWGLPGMEAVKVVFLLASALGLGEGWEDEEDKLRVAVTESEGKTWGEIINSGLLSHVTGIDFSSRMGWKDMVSGFAPNDTDTNGLKSYVGALVSGAPGSMIFDWFAAAQALDNGDMAKALELAVPIKMFSDTTQALTKYSRGKMTGVDALKKMAGFRSLGNAEASRATGMAIRANKQKKDARGVLEKAYQRAYTPEEIAAARRAIQAHNRTAEGRDKISLTAQEKYRQDDLADQ